MRKRYLILAACLVLGGCASTAELAAIDKRYDDIVIRNCGYNCQDAQYLELMAKNRARAKWAVEHPFLAWTQSHTGHGGTNSTFITIVP